MLSFIRVYDWFRFTLVLSPSLWLTVLGHAVDDTVGVEHLDVCHTGILHTTLLAVDESVGKALGDSPDGHLQSLNTVDCLQRQDHIPAQDALAECVHDDGQEKLIG